MSLAKLRKPGHFVGVQQGFGGNDSSSSSTYRAPHEYISCRIHILCDTIARAWCRSPSTPSAGGSQLLSDNLTPIRLQGKPYLAKHHHMYAGMTACIVHIPTCPSTLENVQLHCVQYARGECTPMLISWMPWPPCHDETLPCRFEALHVWWTLTFMV